MTPNEYQAAAARTLIAEPPRAYTANELMTVWCALGLAGEAGESADSIKKAIFHDCGISRDQLIKELGDVAWYLAGLCTLNGITLEEVFDANVRKLLARYPDGFVSGGGVR
jgi:NTP pyrophosphatase (non-canonical NTP hydrolase)